MNDKIIVDPVEMNENKIKLEINNISNNIVDIVDDLNNEFDDEFDDLFKTFNKHNSFIINRYYENKVVEFIEKKYDVIIEKKYKHYEINNVDKFDVELNIIDPIYKSIFINRDDLKQIFKNNIDNIDKIFNSYIKNINELIDLNIDVIFNKYNDNYINKYSIKDKINSYDLLKLFDVIIDDVIDYNEKIENDDEFDDEIIEGDEILKLFKNIVNELNNYSYFNSNKKFKINLKYLNYLFNNNKFNFYNDEYLYELLHNDLIECIDDDLLNLFNIECYNEIDDTLFIENNYIDNLYNDYDINLNYKLSIDKNYNYNEYSIEISIDDILKINENINDIQYLKFDPVEIDKILYNFNNNIDDDLLYLICENDYELLLKDELYYNNCYYELNNIKFYNLYDLKKYMLNYLSTYNLNKSFKFDDELYYIY